jgi:hypothetical protein
MSKLTVVQITKSYRNGKLNKILVINADDDDDIDSQVEEWCNNDSSGVVYGWTATWEEVTDKEVIMKAMIDKIKSIEESIQYKIEKLDRYKKHMKEVFDI